MFAVAMIVNKAFVLASWFVLIVPVFSSGSKHQLSIHNLSDLEVDLSSQRCYQLPLPDDQITMHPSSKITMYLSSLGTVDCTINFSNNGKVLFSMVFINGHAFIHGCKSNRLASQPGYRCALETDPVAEYTLLSVYSE
tara:strand:+ start:239 stop:652 length:414 start_codon:yes stop_codon:yes gene_type:complete